MKNMKSYNIDEKKLGKIISVAYGSASIAERIEVFVLVQRNTEAKKIFNEYKKTAKEVHELQKDELPLHVLEKVKTKVDTDVKEEKTFWSDLVSLVIFKPQVSFAATIIIIAAVTLSILIKTGQPEYKYSQQEIEAATKQTKQALALVSDILLSTKTTITKDIIPNRVIKPVNESFNYVNEFIKGENNETVN